MSRLLTIFLLLALCSTARAERTVPAMVRSVYDGDTILVATRQQNRLKVRLYGIDAPETSKPGSPGQPFGSVSKRTLMYKVMGRRVSVEIMDTDQYGRSVGVVRYEGRDINREMVEEGMAWAYRQYLHGPYASEYIDGEERARARHKGLWRDSNPQPPWEFRQQTHHGRRGRH